MSFLLRLHYGNYYVAIGNSNVFVWSLADFATKGATGQMKCCKNLHRASSPWLQYWSVRTRCRNLMVYHERYCTVAPVGANTSVFARCCPQNIVNIVIFCLQTHIYGVFGPEGLQTSAKLTPFGALRASPPSSTTGKTASMSLFFVASCFFPESVWAQGSSNSGGLYLIFSSSHLLIFTPSHLHTFSSSHLLIFTPSHLHICSSSHPLIITPSHLHTFSSSHLLIFTSAHHICSSHLLIFTPSHLHICSSSHLLIFTSAHLHICSSSHLLSLLSLLFLSLAFLYLSLFRPRVVPAVSHETSTLSHQIRVDRQKLR